MWATVLRAGIRPVNSRLIPVVDVSRDDVDVVRDDDVFAVSEERVAFDRVLPQAERANHRSPPMGAEVTISGGSTPRTLSGGSRTVRWGENSSNRGVRISTGCPSSTVTVIATTFSRFQAIASASCPARVCGNGSSALLQAVAKNSVNLVPCSIVHGPPWIAWITLCANLTQGLPLPSRGFSETGNEYSWAQDSPSHLSSRAQRPHHHGPCVGHERRQPAPRIGRGQGQRRLERFDVDAAWHLLHVCGWWSVVGRGASERDEHGCAIRRGRR